MAVFDFVLRYSFAGIDFLRDEGLSKRTQAKMKDAFTPEHASEILGFVDALPESIKTIVVHCEGGYSRSCAIAQALGDACGYAVAGEELANANPSVWRGLLNSAMGKRYGEKSGSR
ncbi:hypothetical protein [Herbaspirillum seropedicae]|uniref:hypothetical protein n=1 Tax=Herbaspirillum seropedicae TaxID=964 RepID=UPI001FD0D085|nr:hypothetical protein [Herbaspirillum seropedicae]